MRGFLSSSEFLPIGLWGISRIFLEDFCKVGDIVKVQVVGYFLCSPLGGSQQIFGLLDFQFLDIVCWRESGVFLEQFAEPRITHVQGVGHFFRADTFQQVLADEYLGFADLFGGFIVELIVLGVIHGHPQNEVGNAGQVLLAG